jgi:hypothetical protein
MNTQFIDPLTALRTTHGHDGPENLQRRGKILDTVCAACGRQKQQLKSIQGNMEDARENVGLEWTFKKIWGLGQI